MRALPVVCANASTETRRSKLKKLAVTAAIAATVSLTTLIAAGPATAATSRHHQQYDQSRSGPGYYEGDYEYRIDRRDRASSPYVGGVG